MKFIQATITAFASLQVKHVVASTNATGLAWGYSSSGGDATGIDLTNLVDISCGGYACAARRGDGTGSVWGNSAYGGDATGIDLTNLVDISCGNAACVAIQDTTFYISSTPSLTLAPSTFPSMNPSPSLKPTVRVTEKQFYINM